MGKPQKKKHRKMKHVDPFYTGKQPLDRKKELANQPPKKCDLDFEDISKGKMEFIKQLQAVPNKSKKNKFKSIPNGFNGRKQDEKLERGMTRPVKRAPVFDQGENETDKAFMSRVERTTQEILSRAKFEDRYNVEVKDNATGGYTLEKPYTVEGEEPAEANKSKRKKQGSSGAETAITKKKRRNMKKAEKQKLIKSEKFLDKALDFNALRDDIQFGEVAMAPPLLTAKPRNIKEKSNRPGVKSLLLNDMMTQKPKSQERLQGQVQKRKHLSAAEQRISDKLRTQAIETYRQLKKRKMEQKLL